MNDETPNRPRVVVVTNEVPNREHGTMTYNMWLMCLTLEDAGYDVGCVAVIHAGGAALNDEQRRNAAAELKSDGISVTVLQIPVNTSPAGSEARFLGLRLRRKVLMPAYWGMRIDNVLRPRIETYFPEYAYKDRIVAAVQKMMPTAVISYAAYGTTFAVAEGVSEPHMAILGDPAHHPGLYRQIPPLASWSHMLSPAFRHTLWRLWQMRRVMIRELRKYRTIYSAVEPFAAWLRRRGVKDARFIRNLVPDWGGPDWRQRRRRHAADGRLKIVLMGHLMGTATLSGLHCLADDILPELERLMGDGFEIHICGKDEISSDLKARLARPSVRFRGFVDDIANELATCDVFLVSTSIRLGNRVRIIYAWSMGCCVVVHRANAPSLAEMVPGENALVGRNGTEIARLIAEIGRDPDLGPRIGEAGRRTYERIYGAPNGPDSFLKELNTVLAQRVVGNPKPVQPGC